MVRQVFVVPYDPAWPFLYDEEARLWRATLGAEIVDVAHIGSTAVPGLAAKPIVDLLVTVQDVARIDAWNDALAAVGYRARGENGIPGRRYLIKGTDELHTHHAHVFSVGSPEAERHLVFRDYLRAHPDAAGEYARLKQALAAQYRDDPAAYTEAKSAFIRGLDVRAMAWRR